MAGTTRIVAGDGSGYYNCDGVSDDVQIQEALTWAANNPGNEIHLKGPFTYDIQTKVMMGSHTIFSGDSTAILKLNNNCMWVAMAPVIGQIGGTGTVTTDVEICGFKIDCNEWNLTHPGVGNPERIHGKGYYNAIHFQGQAAKHANNIRVHDMEIYNSMGDGTRFSYCSDVNIYNNKMWNLQHSSIFFIDCKNVKAYGNDIQAITCSGIRLDNSTDWGVHDNNIRDWIGTTRAPKGGEHGVQFGNQPPENGHTTKTNNGEVYNNTIDVGGCGLQIEDYLKTAGTSPQTVSIHNNLITGGRTNWASYFAGISIFAWGNGLTISKNTIDGSARSGILGFSAITSGVKVAVSNNNIINTTKAGSEGGYGIWNKISTKLTVTATGNYLNNNISGKYKNVTPVSESASSISDAIPGGGNDPDTPDEPDEPNNPNNPDNPNIPNDPDNPDIPIPDPDHGVYIPPTTRIIDDDDVYYFNRAPRSAYINGVEFQYESYSNTGGKTVGQSKSPSTAGSNLTDAGLEGSTVKFNCFAFTEEERNAVLAAFYRPGRTEIDLGRSFDGYRITGVGESHNSSFDFGSDNPYMAYRYSLSFLNEHPYMDKIQKRVRGRYITESMQFSSDDCFAGNLIKNSSYESWTPNQDFDWNTLATAGDTDLRNVKYSPELGQFCAIADSGTDNRIIISDGTSWAIPTGLTNTNRNNSWRGLAWCTEWGIWVATSISGLAGYACATSVDGNNWIGKATPSAADGMSWGTVVWIPPNGDLPAGRVLVIAYAGSGNRVMYSDDECATWTIVASADDNANWISAAYSPSLKRVVAIAYSGTAGQRAMYSDNYGAAWTISNTPATDLSLTSIIWSDRLDLFVAVAEDTNIGTQVMTSPTGLTGTWTLQNTPYSSYTRTPGSGTEVRSIADDTQSGWNYTTKATSYAGSGGYASLMYTFTLPALSEGHVYRIDNVHCQLKAVSVGITASMKVTIQFASGAETDLKEWTETSTTYKQKSLDISRESATNETVTLRFYLKTSNSAIRAAATLMGYTATEMTAGGDVITYTYNQWRSLVEAPELGLLVAVAKSGTGNRSMYSTDAVNWHIGTSAVDNDFWSVCYAADKNQFITVAVTGVGNRSMYCSDYGDFENVAPDKWTLETKGQSRSEDYATDGLYSYQITANGLSEPGRISQVLPFDGFYDNGEMYVLSGWGKVSGLTSGSYVADIYAGGTVVKQIKWDANTDDWVQKQIQFKFDTVPSRVYARVRGMDTPNIGSVFGFDDIIVEKLADYESSQKGLGITTDGYYDVIPDVTLKGVSVDGLDTPGSRQKSDETEPDQDFDTASTSYVLINTFVLQALTDGSTYKIDELAGYIKCSNTSAYTYVSVTVQAASLFNGVEKEIAKWATQQTDWRHRVTTLSYNLESATNETVTLRYYMKVSKTPYRAYSWKLGYSATINLDENVTSAAEIYIYNLADTRKMLKCCNALPPGYMVRITKNCMGSYRYTEPFLDGRYASNAYSIAGQVARNADNDSLIMSSGSSIVFPFNTLFPVTGIPFIKMYVLSGIPQFSIADSSGENGTPGTFYSIDSNSSTALENVAIIRELDNFSNLKLRGKTKYYLKIEPSSGQSCEFSQMFEYASLDTMDAQRFFVYTGGEANTIGVIIEGVDKCSLICYLEYRDTNILP